jgi:hypothetical protein
MSDDELFPATLPMNQAHDQFMAVAVEKAGDDGRMSRRERKAIQRLERNGWLARLATRRSFERYHAEGGEEGTGQGFLQWLIANWESILKMIMDIVGLFGGLGGAAADMDGVVAPQNFTMPAIDVQLVAEVATAAEAARKAIAAFLEVAKRAGGTIPGVGSLLG